MRSRVDSGLRCVQTVCPFCSCGCGLHLHGDHDGLLGVSPSVGHPVSEGRLCARGWSAHEGPRWGTRIHHPLVREDGVLRRASWREALGVAVHALDELRRSGRPLGVLGSGRASNEENFLAAALARTALGTGNVDAGLRDLYDALLTPRGLSAGGVDGERVFRRLERSDLVVLLEGDLAITHPRMAMGILRALRRGGSLLTVGGSHTRMGRLATVRLRTSGLAPLASLAALRRALSEVLVPGWAGDPEDDDPVRRAAVLLRDARRVTYLLAPFHGDTSVLRAAAATICSLANDLGENGREPPLVLPLPIRANTRGAVDAGAVPGALPGRAALDDAEARERLVSVWGPEASWDAGLSAEEMVSSVSGLVVVADDPASVHPWPSRALEALRELETLVVLDAYLTPTAEAAHVVLPITAFGETAGTVTSLDGRVQRWRPWGPAPASVRPGWEVLRDLLQGLGAAFVPRSLDEVTQGLRLAIPAYGALDPEALEHAWGALLRCSPPGARAFRPLDEVPPGDRARGDAISVSGSGSMLLLREGVFDWAGDPQVASSPILRRSPASRARLHPRGLVVMDREDAAALGVREGWTVRLRSELGQVDVPVTLEQGGERGVLLVPFAFRDGLAALAAGCASVEVEVTVP